MNNDGTSDFQYSWNDSPVSNTGLFQIDTSGIYEVTVVEDHGSSKHTAIEVQCQYPYDKEKIGVVTYDITKGNNMVVWKKTSDK